MVTRSIITHVGEIEVGLAEIEVGLADLYQARIKEIRFGGFQVYNVRAGLAGLAIRLTQ